ncbi:MAG TPA: ABC transporter permease [bacterium (Candidatus Stahlbacteria)]|nr:ABC transporter permease [Candidatus Stahlbacteria bacterium]
MKFKLQFRNLLWGLTKSFVVAEKDARIYYVKPPVLIFGILFPFFLFLAFVMGRGASPEKLVPGLIGMTLFFTASSVGPLVTPWERQARTYERLISTPVPLFSILLGDVIAGFCYGAIISIVPLIIGLVLFKAVVTNYFVLATTMIVSSFCFASLGVLLSSPATEAPSQVMMLSALVRFPLVFVSGIFIPLSRMPSWGSTICLISPLTYATDIIRFSFEGRNNFPIALDFTALLIFSLIFFISALNFHKQSLLKGSF